MASIGDTTRPAFAYDQATDTWVPVGVGPHSHTPAAIGAISNSLTTTTGDLIYAASANTPARLGIGSTGQVLSVSGGVPAWAGQIQTWTPTWTNFTTGNGSLNFANYVQVGKTVYFEMRFTLGSTSAMGTDPTFTLPIATVSSVSTQNFCYLLDAGTASYSGLAEPLNTVCYLSVMNSAGTYTTNASITATAPFTWGANDRIYCSGSYLVA